MTHRLYHFATSAAIAGLLTFSGAALGQSKTKATKGAAGAQHFVTEAAQGGMAEVELGRLATQKASNADVKQFGQRMVDDHSKANDQLKSAAAKSNLTVPTDMGAKHKAEMAKLSKLSGAAFDKAYMSHMVQDHKKDVAEFQKEANSGSDPNIKEFAQQTVPTLQEHLKQAQEVHAKLK